MHDTMGVAAIVNKRASTAPATATAMAFDLAAMQETVPGKVSLNGVQHHDGAVTFAIVGDKHMLLTSDSENSGCLEARISDE